MSGWDETIARLTERLGVDPELQRDVGRELRGHLEDSAAEFRRAGQSEAEAQASAVRALGDVASLSEDLWRANRRRMSCRGVARWTAQIATVPAAIAVVAMIVLGLIGSRPHLTTDQELLLAPAGDWQAYAKAIGVRWPDDPVCWAYYAGALVSRSTSQPEARGPQAAKELAEAMAVLDRGERLEPDNGYYNISKSALLLRQAVTNVGDPATTYEQIDWNGKTMQVFCRKVAVTDRAMFDRGLAELKRGLAKPKFTNHFLDMVYFRLKGLPQAKRLADYLYRLNVESSTLPAYLGVYRTEAGILGGYAVALAREGKAAEASTVLSLADRMSLRPAVESPVLLDVLISQMAHEIVLGHAENVYGILAEPARAEQARARLRADGEFMVGLRKSRLAQNYVQVWLHAGMLRQSLTPGLPGYAKNANMEPMRTAEWYVATEWGLIALLSLTVFLLALVCAVLLPQLFVPRDRRAILILLPLRTLGRIFLWSIGAPLAAYLLYEFVLAPGGREYGLNYTFGKTVLEWVLTFSLMFSLLIGLTRSALSKRAAELGLETPPSLRLRDRRLTVAVGAGILLVAGGYLAGWETGVFRPPTDGMLPLLSQYNDIGPFLQFHAAGLAIALAWVVFLLGVWFREGLRLRRRQWRFLRQTLTRSMVPVAATAVVAAGLLCGLALAQGERQATLRIRDNAAIGMDREVVQSDYRLLQERLAREYAELPKE